MRRYQLTVGAETHTVDVQEIDANQFKVTIGGRELDVTLSSAEDVFEGAVSPEIVPSNGNGNENHAAAPSTAKFRPVPPETLPRMVPAAQPPKPPQPERAVGGSGSVKAPMPGTITAVEVKAGDSVQSGQVLLRLEAMKMVNAIKAPRAGVVAEVKAEAGQSVGYGQVLVTFKEA